MLNFDAQENCRIDNVVCGNRPVDIVSLQISNNSQRNKDGFHFHHRQERAQLLSKPLVGNVQVEELFVKAKEHAEFESSNKNFGNQKAKEKFVQVSSNIVGILGQAGCGKSTLAKTILNRVVNHERLYVMDTVFYFQFRYVNYDDKTSFLKFVSPSLPAEWIRNEQRRNRVLTQLHNSEHVIIIMDGFDEANIDFTRNHQKVSIHDETTARNFIINILDGTILPNAKKLIFSRPRQMLESPDKYRPLFLVNILGLDEKSQMRICHDICGENKDQVYNYIKNHPDILSFSYIPINCILSCFAVNEVMSRNSRNIPQSITGILTYVLGSFVNSENHRGEFEPRNIAELAWQGFKNEKITFQKNDLVNSKLSDNDVDNLFVFVANERKLKMFGGNPQVLSYFSHLILQEYFVAVGLLFYTPFDSFRDLFFSESNNSKHDLSSSRFEMVVKFMYGLCNETTFQNFQEYIPSCLFPCDKLELMQKLPIDTTYKTVDDNVLRYFNWAHELQNNNFTNQLVSRLSDEVHLFCKMLPSDFEALYYVFNNRRKLITLKSLSDVNVHGKCLQGFISDPRFSTSFDKAKQ